MIIDSPLSPKEYKRAARSNIENFRNLWDARYTGCFIGPCFYVTHHCYTEWNRKITGEMNNAIGFIRKAENGCRVYFLHTAGILNPFHFLLYFLISFGLIYLKLGTGTNPSLQASVILLIAVAFTIFIGLFSALQDSLTENGIDGADRLYAFLSDPTFGGNV